MPAEKLVELNSYCVPAEAPDCGFSLFLTPFGMLEHIDHETRQVRFIWLEDHLLTIGAKRYRLGFDTKGDLALYERISRAASGANNWDATSQGL